MKGIAEIISVIMILMITLSLATLTYSYVGGIYAQHTRPVEVVDSYCDAGKITFVIRNGGTVDMNANALTCLPISQTCSAGCSLPGNIPPGGAAAITSVGCTSGRAHTWRLQGPSNSIELYAYCP